jgi:predicted aspartyl protease
MPITPGTFLHLKALAASRNYRAFAYTQVLDSSGTVKAKFNCLVDTGSDYTILPQRAAMAAGLALTGPKVRFRTAGGTIYSLPSHLTVDLVVEGYPVTGQVLFSSAKGFTPILGRWEIVSAFDCGFDTTNWHWG